MADKQQGKIKYLHIMTDTNFNVTASFISMVNDLPQKDCHFFLVDRNNVNPPEKLLHTENVLVTDKLGSSPEGLSVLLSYARRAENIFFHSLGWHWKLQAKLLRSKNILRKSTWIPWGRDLYEFERHTKSFPKNIYYAFTNKIMRSFRKNLSSAAVIFPKDSEKAKSLLGKGAEIYCARYTTFSEEDILRVKPAAKDNCFNILLGHSAAKCLAHGKMLDALSRFKEENIKIYIPLSYGDLAYGAEIASKAREIFGEKAVILGKFMPADDYTALLWQMDAAIFHTDRQVALGNICRLLYMCCKIYTPEGGILSKELTEKGCTFYASDKIGEITFEELTDKAGIAASEWARDSMDLKKTAAMWQDVFESADKLHRGV